MSYTDDRIADLLLEVDATEDQRDRLRALIVDKTDETIAALDEEVLDRAALAVLTDDEHEAIDHLAEAYNAIVKVTGHGPSRGHDLAEVASRIHDLQHTVMAQAAARAYPTLYRLLGESFEALTTTTTTTTTTEGPTP